MSIHRPAAVFSLLAALLLSAAREAAADPGAALESAGRPSDPIAPEIIRKYANFGASIRATMNLVLAAKVRALMEGRYHVTAEDLKKLAPPILRHRVLPNYYAESDNVTTDNILSTMLDNVAVPAGE